MNTEIKKQIAIGKYRDAIEQLAVIKKAWENLKNLKESFYNPNSDDFICVDNFDAEEKIAAGIFEIEINLKQVEEKFKEEKNSAEIELESLGVNPCEIDEIIFSQNEKQEC